MCFSLSLCVIRDSSLQPFSLPHASRDVQGRRHQPGVRDLPRWLHNNFHNLYIHCIIKEVCLSRTPWNNPTLPLLQQELNFAYPAHRIQLHSDDAAVVPVSLNLFRHINRCTTYNTRPSGTSESFETKLETKASLRSSSTCQTSTARGCWDQRM